MNRKQLLIIGIGLIIAILQDNLHFSLGPIPKEYATEIIALVVASLLGWSMTENKRDDEA